MEIEKVDENAYIWVRRNQVYLSADYEELCEDIRKFREQAYKAGYKAGTKEEGMAQARRVVADMDDDILKRGTGE